MRFYLLIFICFGFMNSHSQTITRYYDSTWDETTKENAFYAKSVTKNGDLYDYKVYWMPSGKLKTKAAYTDSNFINGTGITVHYYESGNVEDSMYYNNKGKVVSADHYSENGYKDQHAFYDQTEDCLKAFRYDDKGNKLPGVFTYQRQAMFPGGLQGWISYLQTHLKADIPTRKKAPAGNYTVMVSFLVDKKGKISEVKAINNPGYGTAEEAVRAIQKGPDCLPAIQNDTPVVYRQKQSITFQVIEAKK